MQQQMIAQQIEERQARKQNIQYAAIALGTISFLILFLLLSQSIIVSSKAIKLFGIVALLITFEFYKPLIHPFFGAGSPIIRRYSCCLLWFV